MQTVTNIKYFGIFLPIWGTISMPVLGFFYKKILVLHMYMYMQVSLSVLAAQQHCTYSIISVPIWIFSGSEIVAIYWTTVLLFDLPAKKWSFAGSRKHRRIRNQSARADSCCGPTDIAEFRNRVVCNFVIFFIFWSRCTDLGGPWSQIICEIFL